MSKSSHPEPPKLSEYLFWDVDMDNIDYDKHARHVISRVVSMGKLSDWHEAKRYYGIEKIKEETMQVRSMPPRVLIFLSAIFEVPKENFRCYTQLQSKPKHWIY